MWLKFIYFIKLFITVKNSGVKFTAQAGGTLYAHTDKERLSRIKFTATKAQITLRIDCRF